ncbi:alpha/beta hydrolase [Nodosilinea sp. P-1105]|uniref:alpha/beta fold hydrolase n=1 Tax=Nodosilinea sp. P-1105 TaxID=2546229 RepID=UPI00146D8068|nr:alpha/beta hydrolase [Nodosilinea sp. P-1105]NMF84600.1 alpha/beta hydrolase [Nodosilinea sp. P-1105]
MEPCRHRLQTPTVSLSYLTWGQGPTVMLLHGLADHGLVWQPLAEALGSHYRCLAPDLRGHGDSDKPDDPDAYDALTLVQDLEALAVNDQGDNGAIAVVAHSWAAKLALLWAQHYPQRLRQLILVDPFFVNQLPGLFRPTLPLLYRTLPFLQVMGPFDSYETAAAVARSLKQYRGWSPHQQAVFQGAMEQKPDGRWGSKFAIAARNGVFNDILDRAGLTTDLDVPTLLLLPEQGLNRLAWQLKPYRTHLSNLQIQRIPGNHWPHLVQPAAVNQAVADYLTPSTTGVAKDLS